MGYEITYLCILLTLRSPPVLSLQNAALGAKAIITSRVEPVKLH